MAYNQYGTHDIDSSSNRVYINPNFQRKNVVGLQNSSMYVNPLFYQQPNSQLSNVNKPKIYINPSFVRKNGSVSALGNYSVNSASPMNNSSRLKSVAIKNSRIIVEMAKRDYTPLDITANTIIYNHTTRNDSSVITTECIHKPNIILNVSCTAPQTKQNAIAKSRYSLVRQKANEAKTIHPQKADEYLTKLKISKYKTVSVHHTRKLQIQKDKPILSSQDVSLVTEKARRISDSEFIQSRFKLVKNNMGMAETTNEIRTPTQRKHSNINRVVKSNQKVKTKVNKTVFKKNNIPCPLFKKYGTCLRNTKGRCEFLHDKKHVSICRKFLKGICHDNNCLLSHQVTAEKMPTCSFYLRGMCTKEDCPYLHVKLNEKSKVCLDFLKGYCEKGDKCFHRHVDICTNKAKNISSKKQYVNRQDRLNKMKTKVSSQSMKSKLNRKINKKPEISPGPTIHKSNDTDCRYYKKLLKYGSLQEEKVIKPTRCKLGALPSFIQL